ncbi:MAG: exopolyphosphatase [bacterium]|nr:exopolyphosphatase [bacterium]
MLAVRVCAIDVGTNSVRGLVAEVNEHGQVRVLHREGNITRLGEGLSQTGVLDEQAIERTARAVEKIAAKARSLNAARYGVIATSAARNASNSGKLKDRIRELTSLETEVITGQEEARYVCEGVLRSLELAGETALLADIGGGSTELVFAPRAGREPLLTFVEIGCVGITELFLHHDPPREEELSRAIEHATRLLRNAASELPAGANELIGLGGTITTIPAILLRMAKYDGSRVHNFVLTREHVESVLHRLASMGLEKRKNVVGLERGRADIIVGGIVAIKALLAATGFQKLRVSDRGILVGVALSLWRREG